MSSAPRLVPITPIEPAPEPRPPLHLQPAIPLPGLTADLVLAEPEPTPLPEEALVELPEDAIVELPADAIVELPPLAPDGGVAYSATAVGPTSGFELQPLAIEPKPSRSIDLCSAVLGSEEWRNSIGDTPPQAVAAPTAPDVWPPAAEDKQDQLCPNLATLRFGAPEERANDATIDVPRTPPPPPRPVAPPPMVSEEITRPLPEIARVRHTPARGTPRPVDAPSVVGVDAAEPRIPRPRTPTPRPVTGHRQIKERARTEDLPGDRPRRAAPTKNRKADTFYEEALKSMAAHDYQGAYRHLTLALTFAPGDPRFITARQKVQRILSL